MFNVILQHNKRQNNKGEGDFLKIREYNLHHKYKNILQKYGFNKDIKSNGESIMIGYNDVIKPNSKNWDVFLYLVGVLMESDIEAIKEFHS